METQELKKFLAGLGVAGLIAGAGLILVAGTGGTAAGQVSTQDTKVDPASAPTTTGSEASQPTPTSS